MSDEFDFDNLFPKKVAIEPVEPARTALTLMEEYNSDDWLKPIEVGEIFGVDPKTVTRWKKSGKLDNVKTFKTPGGHRRYFAPDLKKLMDDHEKSNGE